ncbi:MAG: hypothetical protein AAGE43_10145 [Pseudomonadota bacterium]
MRTLVFAAACLFTGAVFADTAVVKVYSLDVQERVQNLELIDVTAEKSVSDEAEAPDAELQAILDEAAELEIEE